MPKAKMTQATICETPAGWLWKERKRTYTTFAGVNRALRREVRRIMQGGDVPRVVQVINFQAITAGGQRAVNRGQSKCKVGPILPLPKDFLTP